MAVILSVSSDTLRIRCSGDVRACLGEDSWIELRDGCGDISPVIAELTPREAEALAYELLAILVRQS